MKRKLLIPLLAALICAGCNSAPAGTAATAAAQQTAGTKAAETSADTAEAEVKPAETTADTAAGTTAEKTEQTAENEDAGKTPISYTVYFNDYDPEKYPYYLEDAQTESDYFYSIDYTYAFPARGIYDDSTMHPEDFDIDAYEYNGALADTPIAEMVKVGPGDTLGKAKIKTAKTMLDMNMDPIWPWEMLLVYDGEYELTGTLRYFAGDDYGISAGDVVFYPDAGIEGYPLFSPFANPSLSVISENVSAFSEMWAGLRLGNTINGISSLSEQDIDPSSASWEALPLSASVIDGLNGIIGSGTEDVAAKVKVKLSEITLLWTDQFGCGNCKAMLNSIETM